MSENNEFCPCGKFCQSLQLFSKLGFDNFYQEVAHALIVKTAGSAVPRPNAKAKMKRKRLFFQNF